MNRIDSYLEDSRNDFDGPIGFTKNEISSKGIIALGVVLFGISTIVGGYMISGLGQFPTSFMIVNFFVWTTSLGLILFGYNKRNI
jgi:hypothetical protein